MNVTEISVHMARKNMNKTTLAKALNVSPATITRWFANEDMPISKAELMIDVLGISKDDSAPIFFNREVS